MDNTAASSTESYDVTLNHPSRWLIYGPSSSGKSTFVSKILQNLPQLFGVTFRKIIYCYGQSKPDFPKEWNVIYRKGVSSDLLQILNSKDNTLLIIDDCMRMVCKDPFVSDLFTKLSHHLNVTVFVLLQNLFPKGKDSNIRDISLNSTYIVLMRNPREISQIQRLGISVYGNRSRFLVDAFNDATRKEPYSYLLVDFSQSLPDFLRVRTSIFPKDKYQSVYIPEHSSLT
jgi:hypothetical protein